MPISNPSAEELKYLKMPYCGCSSCEEIKKELKKKISKKSVLLIDKYRTKNI